MKRIQEALDFHAVFSRRVAHLARRQPQEARGFGLNQPDRLHGIDQTLAFIGIRHLRCDRLSPHQLVVLARFECL